MQRWVEKGRGGEENNFYCQANRGVTWRADVAWRLLRANISFQLTCSYRPLLKSFPRSPTCSHYYPSAAPPHLLHSSLSFFLLYLLLQLLLLLFCLLALGSQKKPRPRRNIWTPTSCSVFTPSLHLHCPQAGNWHPIAKCLCLWHSSSRCWHWHSSWNCSWLPLLALAMTKAYWQIIQPLAHIAAIVWRQRATITKETTTRTIEGRATNIGCGGGQQINRKVEQIEKRFKQIIKKVANIKTRRATSDDEVLLPNVLVG